MRNNLLFDRLYSTLWALVAVTLCFPHAFNSVSIILVSAFSVIRAAYTAPPRLTKASALGIAALVLLLFVYLLWYISQPSSATANHLVRKLPLALLPIMWWLGGCSYQKEGRLTLSALSITLCVCFLMMLGESLFSIVFGWGDLETLMYHRLMKPVPISAVYFAWFSFTALCWIYLEWLNIDGRWKTFAAVTLPVALLLSASKLFAAAAIAFGVYYLWMLVRRNGWRRTYIVIVAGVCALSIPVSMRFSEVLNPNLQLAFQDSYRYDSPFNGANLRLTQWRFGVEILNREKAWMLGVGPQHKQQKLNQRYEETGMYTGNPNFNDLGYRAYNYHNQYIETLVGTGAVGLALLLIALAAAAVVSARYRNKTMLALLFVALLFMCTESVLERQQGVVMVGLVLAMAWQPPR